MRHPVLLDNTLLTNFAWAGFPDLLFALWPDQVCTTPAVMQEYHKGITEVGLPAKIWDTLPVRELTPGEKQWSAALTTAFV